MNRSEEILSALAHPLTPLQSAGAARESAERLTLEKSRSGEPTLSFQAPRGRRYVHSRYAPRREAERLAERQEGFLVILGLGLGYLAVEYAAAKEAPGVLVVEPSKDVVSLLRRSEPLHRLADAAEGVRVLYLPTPSEVEEAVSAFYIPAIHERISLYATPGYEELIDPAPYRSAFERGVARATGNYHTMARFGKSWTTNILANTRSLLAAAGGNGSVGLAAAPSIPLEAATIVGAGPTLEEWLDGTGSSGPLLAADTALPRLLRAGVSPDLVLSIDANPATYHHFLTGPSWRPSILADLTAPPMLRRYAAKIGYFGGGHPLGALLLEEEELLRGLSTEGGNVGFTLLSAAAALGARRVAVVGLDYAYLRGRAYARGTYLDDYFLSTGRRLAPVEGSWSSLLYRDPEAKQIPGAEPWSYREPRLVRYAGAFEKLVGELEATGVRVVHGPEMSQRPGRPRPRGGDDPNLPGIKPPQQLPEALERLKKALETPISPRGGPLWALRREERALLPLAAWYASRPGLVDAPPLEAARVFTLKAIGKGES